MIAVTATQAEGDFTDILDQVERGETILITRDGIPVGRLAPERRTSAERLKAALRDNPADEGFADDLEAARADLRELFTTTDVKAEFNELAGVRSEVIPIP